MSTHIQCKLSSKTSVMTSWIPEKLAKKNALIRLKDENGWDEDIWKVEEVYSTHKRDSKEVLEKTQDYKKMRKRTDI